jgi:hypothetical protein
MTALRKYEKLEATALWREALATQRREVYVSFGESSLMIRNQADDPLSHWSLAAVERLNPGQRPAIYAPNAEAAETLEIEDATMIEAIEKVRAAIARRRPRPGRLRWLIVASIVLAIAALGVLWLPGALERQTLKVVPFEKRREIGFDLLDHIARLSGRPCSTPSADRALGRLERRLLGTGGAIRILPAGVTKSGMLPGRLVVLNHVLVEDFEGPEVAAGYVVLELAKAGVDDPLARLLRSVGPVETFRLLTTGNIGDAALAAYAEIVLTVPSPRPADAVLLPQFAAAGVPTSPVAYEEDMTGETTLTLIEADPFRSQPAPSILGDSDWVSLQGICGG